MNSKIPRYAGNSRGIIAKNAKSGGIANIVEPDNTGALESHRAVSTVDTRVKRRNRGTHNACNPNIMVAQTDVPESDPEDYYSYLAFARLFGELDILRIENPLLSKHACTGRNTLKLEFIRAE